MTNVDDLIKYTNEKCPLISTIEKLTGFRVASYRAFHMPGVWIISVESSRWCQKLDAPRYRKVRTTRQIDDREITNARDALTVVEHNIQGCVRELIEHLTMESYELTSIKEKRERRWRWLRAVRDRCRRLFSTE